MASKKFRATYSVGQSLEEERERMQQQMEQFVQAQFVLQLREPEKLQPAQARERRMDVR